MRLRLAELLRGLHLRMNARNERVKVRPITLSESVDHYLQRELKPDTLWKPTRSPPSAPEKLNSVWLAESDNVWGVEAPPEDWLSS